jgi:hypothetical protein
MLIFVDHINQERPVMNEQHRKTLSRSLFILSGVIIVAMVGLGILGALRDSPPSSPTPTTEQQLPDDTQQPNEPSSTDDSGILGQIWGFIVSIWNFFGRVGLIAQLLCCLVVPILLVVGIMADKPL